MANYLSYTDAELAAELRAVIDDTKDSHRRRKSAGTITSAQSAGILERLRAGAERLEQLAKLSPLQQQLLGLVLRIEAGSLPEPEPVRAPVVYITGEQTERITRLANHPLLPRPEKTQALLKINRLHQDEAAEYIAQLEQRTRALDALPHLSGPAPATHPALALTARDAAYEELAELLRDPLVRDEERVKAGEVMPTLSEAQLREKTAVVRKAIAARATAKQPVAA